MIHTLGPWGIALVEEAATRFQVAGTDRIESQGEAPAIENDLAGTSTRESSDGQTAALTGRKKNEV